MQKIEDIKLQRVLSRIESLKKQGEMRFPVAEIAEKTKFSKGQVSHVINGKISMSQKFYDSFVKNFGLDEEGDIIEGTEPLDKVISDIKGWQLSVDSRLNVISSYLAQLASKETGKSLIAAMNDLKKDYSNELGHLFEELKKKH